MLHLARRNDFLYVVVDDCNHSDPLEQAVRIDTLYDNAFNDASIYTVVGLGEQKEVNRAFPYETLLVLCVWPPKESYHISSITLPELEVTHFALAGPRVRGGENAAAEFEQSIDGINH